MSKNEPWPTGRDLLIYYTTIFVTVIIVVLITFFITGLVTGYPAWPRLFSS
jgi:preprotein translocase subunit SecE